jgi:phage tail sheath protein FI
MIVDAVGAAGNDWKFEILPPAGTVPLSAAFAPGTTNHIQVTLAAVAGTPTNAANTSILVAVEVAALAGVTAAGDSTDTDSFDAAVGPISFSGGRDALPYFEITDDGAGVLNTGVGITGPGAITYATGAYSFTMAAGLTINTAVSPTGVTTTTYTAVAHDQAPVLCDYQIDAWETNPISAGAWGNDLRLDISGNDDFFTASSASYSRFNANVLLENAAGTFDILETYEELVFDDPTDVDFWADVVNELSDLISIEDPGGNEAPLQLNGVSRTNVLGGGDESSGGRTYSNATDGTALSDGPIATRTVSIVATDTTGGTMTVTDDGNGSLIGDIDPAGTNTINYVSGALEFTFVSAVDGNTLVTATYASQAAETVHSENYGGSDGPPANPEGYEVGTDGTFPITRSEVSSPLLEPTNDGIFALNTVDELMQVCVPDFVGDEIVTGDLIDFAETRAGQPSGADRFLILQVPQGSDAQEAVDWLQFTLGRNTIHGALYWPWVRVADPLANGRPLTMPALGHLAGIYARTDNNKNVGKAPGGTVDGALRFLIGLERNTVQGERDFVYPKRVNPLISSPQTGLAVWGVRTMYGPGQSEWRYINARRLFNFLEKSIFNATHWIVFENNGPALWAKIATQLSGFLTALFNEGLFAGTTPSEAFFVIVDSSNNTPESIELGQVIIDVGVAPNRPAEFVRFRFTQKALE